MGLNNVESQVIVSAMFAMVSLITNYMHTCIIIMYPHANYTRIPILQLFSLGTIIRCIVMLIFILLAKFKYKCPNYDPLSDGNLELL